MATAGLLTGYRATCHWSSIDQLSLLGAEPVLERVVRERNRMTGAGVTSGIDFALSVLHSPDGAGGTSCSLTLPESRSAPRPRLPGSVRHPW
ncbi:DJ-1/PfpI family protein [Cupriavidus sp. UME77]|uniref:DJ-1/PfpI family protein n=1 Tax=Cupriavidus sp. UME77 TaxID=1862321 RepID=UPI00351C8E3E